MILLSLMPYLSYSQPSDPFEPAGTTLGLWHMETWNPQIEDARLFEGEYPQWFTTGIRAQDDNFLVVGGLFIDDTLITTITKISPDHEVLLTNSYVYSDETNKNICYDIAEMENGNIIVVGYARGMGFNIPWMLTTDREGEVINSVNLFEDEHAAIKLSSVLIDEDGSMLVGGRQRDFQINKYSDERELIWEYSTEAIRCIDIIQTSDGGYLGVGYDQYIASTYGFISKLSTDGELEWEQQYGLDDRSAGFKSVLESENGFLCSGWITPQGSFDGSDAEIWFVSFDREGNVIQDVTISREVIGRCTCNDMVISPDGNILITGSILDDRQFIPNGIFLLRVNEDFEVISTETFSEIEFSSATSILSNPDQTYTIFGRVNQIDLRGSDDAYENGLILTTTADYHWTSDFSDNGNDFIIEGHVGLTDGVWGEALDLTTHNSGIALVDDNESLRPEQFRIEAWFHMDSEIDHTGVIVSKLIEIETASFMLYADNENGSIGFSIQTEEGEEYLEHPADVSDGDWHYIAGDFDGDRMRLIWEDGLVRSQSVENTILYGEGPLVFGSNVDFPNGDLQFLGQIDEVIFSNTPFDEVGVNEKSRILLPGDLAISAVYPNPFNSTTMLSYVLPIPSPVSLKVFNLAGREVQTLIEERMQAGEYKVLWDAWNIPGGCYLLKLNAGQQSVVRKVSLVR